MLVISVDAWWPLLPHLRSLVPTCLPGEGQVVAAPYRNNGQGSHTLGQSRGHTVGGREGGGAPNPPGRGWWLYGQLLL